MPFHILRFAAVGLSLGVAALVATPFAHAGKKDDTIVWSTERDNPIADPYYNNTRELVIIGHHVWDTLMVVDPKTNAIKPQLAAAWTWANDTTLEVELRKGVKFHSGKEMDAEDVAYTINHVVNKENGVFNVLAARPGSRPPRRSTSTRCASTSHARSRLRSPIWPQRASSCRRGTTTLPR